VALARAELVDDGHAPRRRDTVLHGPVHLQLASRSGGTALTAVFTDHVFHDPRSIGRSISAVAIPAALIAFILLRRVRIRRDSALTPDSASHCD
jgi:hypothetical protein